MCECRNHRPTGRETADKLWGNGRTSQTTNWPPISKKPKPFTDAETAALTKIIQDSVSELRRKPKPKPALSVAQIAEIRRIVQDAVKPPAREGYRLGADSGRYAEKVTKLRTADPAMNGKIVTIGNMRCQLVHGKMVCR